MNSFVSVLIIIAILVAQQILSSRNNAYWGAVMPVLFITGMTWLVVTHRLENIWAIIVFLVLGIGLLAEQWSLGRKSLAKKRKMELDKMKTHDIK